jgi:Domain of unknown function (DUF4279)
MSGSATSPTKSKTGTVIALASLIFAGDRLDPDRITALLGVQPTTAYRKGGVYRRSRGHEARGRTGLWLLSSKMHVLSADLSDHLAYLAGVFNPDNGRDLIGPIRAVMREAGLEAEISCFWHGEHGAEPPVIPESIRAAFARLGATIETDFDTD